jgi:hypothetical protein
VATFLTHKMVFLHLPKTGGTWAAQAVEAAGVPQWRPDPCADRHYSGHGHADLADISVEGRFAVAFVRHPLDWWRSYWGHRMRTGWRADNGIDLATRSEDFDDFIGRVLEHCLGYVDELVERFVGAPEAKVDFVGRFESLEDDLCMALRLGDEPFSEQALRAYPRQNASEYERFPASYRPELAERLADAERRTIERFYAHDPIPAALVAGSPGVSEDRSQGAGSESSQRLREHVDSLERALESARGDRRDIEAQLMKARLDLEHTSRSLRELRGSRTIRSTRALRTAYYRITHK